MDQKFVYLKDNKLVVKYAGLLDEAHQIGRQGGTLAGMTTALIQIGTAENEYTWIVQAIIRMSVSTPDGVRYDEYSAIGDANPRNVGKAILSCLPRMAETRAKGRALRDALNVGALLDDELSDTPPPTRQSIQRGATTTERPPWSSPSTNPANAAQPQAQTHPGPIGQAVTDKREAAAQGDGKLSTVAQDVQALRAAMVAAGVPTSEIAHLTGFATDKQFSDNAKRVRIAEMWTELRANHAA